MTARSTLLVSLVVLAVAGAVADSGAPVKARTYSSANGEFHLTVDPRWTDGLEMRPLLTLRTRDGEVLWKRVPGQFEEFHYPMHACVSDDGKYLVLGGYSVHNLGHYQEGLRFYGPTGQLIRYYSRRDLPAGVYSVSTAHWYDAERSRLVGRRFFLYTPERDVPTVFAVETGELVEGSVVAGQGDDKEHWRRRWQLGDSEG